MAFSLYLQTKRSRQYNPYSDFNLNGVPTVSLNPSSVLYVLPMLKPYYIVYKKLKATHHFAGIKPIRANETDMFFILSGQMKILMANQF